MVIRSFFLVFLLLPYLLFGGNDAPFTRLGLIKTDATISPGWMLNHGYSNIYVSGDLEFFTAEKFSFRSTTHWYIDSQEDPALLDQNSRIVFGPVYHWVKKNFDFGIAFQPGVAFTKPNLADTSGSEYPYKVLPAITLGAGITYYVWDYCNFFLNANYTHAQYTGLSSGSLKLDEICISAGLGLQLHTFRKKK